MDSGTFFFGTTLGCCLIAAIALSSPALANESDWDEEITIVGERFREKQATGAAQYISQKQLEKFAYTDIQRVLRQVPGVSIQIEDGYGLRPNISIRGVTTERSSRITLLEDNLLIAPAPYSAPSAYYFPTAGRMHAVEILKGPAAITQGPYTIGGALNMVSTPIPRASKGNVVLEAGEDATYRLHASYGSTSDSGFGFLLETHQWKSDGFQDVDHGDGDTGLDVEDYMLKLSYAPVGSPHMIDVKFQYTNQDSEQSYLGLTDIDFRDSAFRRYGLSALDNIHTEHEQQVLRYRFKFSESMTLSATAYNNQHERDWFKTEGIDFDGSANAGEMSRTSWFKIIQAVNSGDDIGGLMPDQLQGILDGTTDTVAGSIQVRSNAREYFSRGLQFRVDWNTGIGNSSHSIQLGLRFHEDEEDRLQRNSSYHQADGRLVLDDIGLAGNAGNRVQEAKAISFHVYDRIELGNWVFTPGIRFEDIEQKRTRWETRTGKTNDPSSRADSNIRDTRQNHTEVWLPGVGVLYSLTEEITLLGGVHKGFTAPSNSPGAREEEAINYELGFRYNAGNVSSEVIYFLSDYDNLLGECTASSGSDCMVGDAFNGDAATVHGLELMIATNLFSRGNFTVPLNFNYTYIDSTFDSDVANTDFFGDVSKGDPIPYVPQRQFNLSVGIEQNRWAVYLSANYVDEVCVKASCNAFEKTDSTLTIDLSGNFDLTNSVSLFGKIENLSGQEDIMGRQPYGARPNKDRTATVGVRIHF
ncbi:MAG: TonB-dependent receptor [Gammaproteobacteria bacterium]|nr:TonB-dependent receptor [Gammaproteobacteria bacterium]